MASEFTRKIQRIKDILTFNSILADDGDILLTKSGEVYTQVNGKVKQLSNPNYGAGNVNKILAVSGTGEVVPIQMPSAGDILGKDNTFSGANTFSKPIIGGLSTRQVTFTDFNDIANNINEYAGQWHGGSDTVKNMPEAGYFIANISQWSDDNKTLGYITLKYTDHSAYIVGYVANGTITWHKLAYNDEVLHNSGNETASGDKTFNGQTTLLNGNFGLRVTNSGIVKTTDAGKTWVAL